MNLLNLFASPSRLEWTVETCKYLDPAFSDIDWVTLYTCNEIRCWWSYMHWSLSSTQKHASYLSVLSPSTSYTKKKPIVTDSKRHHFPSMPASAMHSEIDLREISLLIGICLSSNHLAKLKLLGEFTAQSTEIHDDGSAGCNDRFLGCDLAISLDAQLNGGEERVRNYSWG